MYVEFEVGIDCPPCSPRPDTYIGFAESVLGVEHKETDSRLFGAWTWHYIVKCNSQKEADDLRIKIATNNEELFQSGKIRGAVVSYRLVNYCVIVGGDSTIENTGLEEFIEGTHEFYIGCEDLFKDESEGINIECVDETKNDSAGNKYHHEEIPMPLKEWIDNTQVECASGSVKGCDTFARMFFQVDTESRGKFMECLDKLISEIGNENSALHYVSYKHVEF